MTATKRLMSQKLSTMIQTMKKKQDTKNSESIIWYTPGRLKAIQMGYVL